MKALRSLGNFVPGFTIMWLLCGPPQQEAARTSAVVAKETFQRQARSCRQLAEVVAVGDHVGCDGRGMNLPDIFRVIAAGAPLSEAS